MRTKLYLILFLAFHSYHFALVAADSLKIYAIDEVSVTHSRGNYFSDDKKILVVDSLSMSLYKHGDLGQLLSGTLPVNIRQYGAEGSVSMISVRGLRANHVQVNWNGISLNSVTTGDNDLSLIPTGLVDEISYNSGAPGSLYGSGTFGAAVEVVNKPDWNNRFGFDFQAEWEVLIQINTT
ncbi:MAG: TonB-dependent receptor plug domain-containing protein [Bacteroidales bacterium]|nr:TonB-dependent receptor plug domain-containing protein [Bacteroidales bacterium]